MSSLDRFRVLASIAIIDGTLDPTERPILEAAAREMGISDVEIEETIEEVASGGKVTAAIPKDPGERAKLFRSLVDMVAADGTVDDHEMSFFKRLAPQFNLNELEVEDILHAATKGKK